MLHTIVPDIETDIVAAFCSKVFLDQKPVIIPVATEPYCRKNECFDNVEEKVKRDGGSLEHGWQVWMWPELFIEAEFHAVWKSPDGGYLDITPKDRKRPTILFIPDNRIRYEGLPVDNKRKSISTNQLVDLYLAIAEARFLLMRYGSKPYEANFTLSPNEADLYRELDKWRTGLTVMFGKRASGNRPCPCKSGRKIKSCCGKRMLDMTAMVKRKYA